jgi:hypothetical protein
MQTTATAAPRAAGTRPNPLAHAAPGRRASLWTARTIGGFVALFLLFDGAARLVRFAPYVEGTVRFGYPEEYASWIGLTLVISTLLYLVPRTAVLGAVLVTGYLGGAAAGHVRAEDPWFLFPVALGVLAWGALYLCDPRVRALLPLRR